MQNSKIRFGVWEMALILINSMCGPLFLNFPRQMVDIAGTAGWLVVVFISVIVFIIFMIIAKLYQSFEGKDLLDIGEYIGGGIVRVIVGVLLLAHVIIIVPLILREYGEDMKIIALTNSPISFVEIFFLVGAIIAGYLGIEAIVRYGAIAIPVIIAGFYLIILCVIPHFSFDKLLPILGNGLPDILKKGLLSVSTYSALIILYIFAPYLQTHKNFKKAGYIAIGISGMNYLIATMAYSMIFAYPTSLENFLPVYSMARVINFGRLFQRIESIFVLIWAMSALIYLSMAVFAFVHIFKKTFKLPYFRPLLIPVCIIIFSLSLLPPSLVDSIDVEVKIFRSYAWVTTFALPIILLVIARVIKHSRKKGVVM